MAQSKRTRQGRSSLYEVALHFASDPQRCLKDKSAREVLRGFGGCDHDWNELFNKLWALFEKEQAERSLAEHLADLLAGYCLVRFMESPLKGTEEGALGHDPFRLGRGFRGKLSVHASEGTEKIGTVSMREVFGTTLLTPMVTARLKTRLLLEMSSAFGKKYPLWTVRKEFLPKAWKLVRGTVNPTSIPRVLRRSRQRQSKKQTKTRA